MTRMTREGAVKVIEGLPVMRYMKKNEKQTIITEALDKAIEALREWTWIPVSERVPDENGNYLITVRSYDETGNIDFICVDHCNSDGTWLHYKNSSDKKKDKVVIAWMPLPEPYKAGEQDD